MRIHSLVALVWSLSGCESGRDPDKSVADASPDNGDPCASNLGAQPVPLVDGSSPECPRCSPYSQTDWDPACSRPGLVCEYQGSSFGALCRCGELDADAGAPSDGAPPLKFGCGL